MRTGCRVFVAVAATACLFSHGVAAAQSSGRRVLDGVEIEGHGAEAVVVVRFSVPMRILRHFPEARGLELRVSVVSLGVEAESSKDPPVREAVASAVFDDRVPLGEVVYEAGDAAGTAITLRFARAVSYRVSQGSDLRSVRIELPGPSVTSGSDARALAAVAAATAPPPRDGGQAASQVVNLASFDAPIDLAHVPGVPELAGKSVTVSELKVKGRTWYRLRLGNFASVPEAELAASRARSIYPQAWVETAPAAERVTAGAPERTAVPTATGVVAMMTQGRQAMNAGDYDRAIVLYTEVLEHPEGGSVMEAQEMLGVAHERKGQLAHAKAEYETYLAEWPDGEDSDRVRQRLNSLVGRGSKPKDKLRETASADGWSFNESGSFSSYYRREERYADKEGDQTTLSIADTNLDLGLRASRGANDLRLAFNGGYTLDLLQSDDSETDVNELYVQYARTSTSMSARAGRQSRSKGGVLGRFDGMLFGYKPTAWANVNVAAGFPVKSWEDTVKVDDERRFAGVSVDLGTFADHWDFNLFFIEQEVSDITDRRAVGGEVRYFDRERSVFALLDYDVFYDVLNTAYVIGSTTLPYDFRADASVRYGTTPILTTSNALIGQPFDSMHEMLDVFSDDEVYDLARDRTADGVTVTASATRDLTERLQLSGDFAYSTLSSTDTSGGVEEIPDTGNEFFYGIQLIGNGLFKEGDVSVAGLRYTDGENFNVLSLDLNTRFPIRTVWRLNPRLIFDYEPGGEGADRDLRVRPRLRLEYRWRKRHRFEIEGGGQWIREGTGADAENVYGYTAEAGYRFDF